MQFGHGPLVATAVHDGHAVREEVALHLALTDDERLREEDPFTAGWTSMAPNRVIALRSRFEVDLNRPRNKAVYRTPEDAWGLRVWKGDLPDDVAARSLAQYDAFYVALGGLYSELAAQHGVFVVFDLHAYNHKRGGHDGEAADPTVNPQVNVGTRTMSDRGMFAGLIDRFLHELSAFDFAGGHLDVRENVKFFGGNHALWAHQTFDRKVCVLSVEFKKFFMDEWSGQPHGSQVELIGKALASTVPGVLSELGGVRR